MTKISSKLEGEYYHIEIGADPEFGKPVYNIVNKETQVVEYEDVILPRTIEALENLDEKLRDILSSDSAPKLEVIDGTRPH